MINVGLGSNEINRIFELYCVANGGKFRNKAKIFEGNMAFALYL